MDTPLRNATGNTPAHMPREDRVVTALGQVAAEYHAVRVEADATAAALVEERAERARLADALATTQAQLTAVERGAERERERGERLTVQLREVHRALFRGDVYDLILRACLSLTGATRGVYLTSAPGSERVRVRAAFAVPTAGGREPSPFVRALAERVLNAEEDAFTYNTAADFAVLPPPDAHERFRNCIAASVVLMRDLDGVIVVADKEGGAFDPDDAAMLIHVGDQSSVTVENARLRRELEGVYRTTISVLADAMRAKDPYTHGHSLTVARYALRIARHLGLSAEECNVACYGALLHDIGKIGVSDGILNKPGPLLPEERDLVRAHVRIGHDLLRQIPSLVAVAHVLLHHHEWYDGNGYPDGLEGERIPLIARIVSVVDCFSAMTTKRSYKDAYSHDDAREELIRCAGTQFDPQVVDAFFTVLDSPDDPTEEIEDLFSGLLPGFANLRDRDPTNDDAPAVIVAPGEVSANG